MLIRSDRLHLYFSLFVRSVNGNYDTLTELSKNIVLAMQKFAVDKIDRILKIAS